MCKFLLLASLWCSAAALAQTWPTKPIRLVVPYTAGGSGDIVARAIAQKMSEGLGEQVIVDNRAGANGNIGTEMVARSPADGYTLLLATDIQFAISPALGMKLPYDPVKDFEPVSLVAFVDLILAANPALKANNMQELVALARAQPGVINYASTGLGSTHHLSIELLKSMGSFDVTHVPYKGSAQALPDLIANQVQMMQLGVPQTLTYLKSGQLKALGVGSAKRLAVLPDVPTIAEQGFAGFDAAPWWYVAAPAGTPPDIVKKLSDEITKGIKSEAVIKKIREAGAAELPGDAAALVKQMESENVKWKKVIAAAKLEPQ
jgi:tripartite-type tricarboxylate transporter receptor subunit TctC